MNSTVTISKLYILFFTAALLSLPFTSGAQRMGHRSPSRSARPAARPSTRPATRPSTSPATRPSTQPANRPGTRPSTRPSQPVNTRPSNRPSYSNGAINGGSRPAPDRDINKRPATRDVKRGNVNTRNNNYVRRTNVYVRTGPRPYHRPPYAYGHMRFYAHHPYHYHHFRPYYWGPAWHPWGFFVATMAATAIIVSIHNQQYYYNSGVFYEPANNGYTVVQAPVGATVEELPEKTETMVINETTNNYYYGGTYYEKTEGGYTVVPPTAGTLVEHLPEGAEEVKVGDNTYVKLGEVYYQPVKVDGKDMYEVVEVQEGEDDNKSE